MTLNKEGLEAAHAAYAKTTGGMLEGHPMANAITAYLAALPDTDGLVERLRERYTPEPVPPCSVCGKPLTVQSAGGGNVTIYGCEAHTPFDAEHYDRSRWKQFRPGDRDVLEAATVIQTLQKRAEAAEQQVRDMRAGLEFYRDGFKFTTNPRYGGLEWKPTEALLDDCGNIARLSLKEGGE